MHRRFCSTYIQLSQLYTFSGLSLLQLIDIIDINNQPHSQLYDKDWKLDNVSHTRSDAWKKEIKAKRIWGLRQNKDLLNQNFGDKKMEWYNFENLELIIASVGCIYVIFFK